MSTGLTPRLVALGGGSAPTPLVLEVSLAEESTGRKMPRDEKSQKDLPTPKTPRLDENSPGAGATGAESSSSEEESESDEDSCLHRLAQMHRQRDQTSSRSTPAGKASAKTRSPPAADSEKRSVTFEGSQSHDGTPATPLRAEPSPPAAVDGWQSSGKARRNRKDPATPAGSADASSKEAPKSAPAALSGFADDDEGDDWSALYAGKKDDTHRVRGKHGRNLRQQVCRAYAREKRAGQREGAAHS